MADPLVIEFTVIGIPAPQGSKTPWGTEANKNTGPWRGRIAADAREAMAQHEPLDGPLRVTGEFVFPRPKSHYISNDPSRDLKDSAPHFHTGKPDLDKLQRAVGDALTGVVFRDDSQVAVWEVSKRYGWPACVELEIDEAV